MAEYDTTTARHYAAWRPPLHQKILDLAIAPGEHFVHGLDVGCGTGQSTRALATFCDDVIGVDPSQQMIDLAEGNDRIRFLAQTRNKGKVDQGFIDGPFDVFTFAGSLHYQEPEIALDEISWLASEPATIIVYDFNVLLDPVFASIDVMPEAGDYDHQKNFGKVDKYGLKEVLSKNETITFTATSGEVSHLLFSVKEWREGVLAAYSYGSLTEAISQRFPEGQIRLAAETFLTRYTIP